MVLVLELDILNKIIEFKLIVLLLILWNALRIADSEWLYRFHEDICLKEKKSIYVQFDVNGNPIAINHLTYWTN